MDQLVNTVCQKTGITEQQARDAVQTVVGFIKGKLPPPMASQLDGLLSGQGMPDLGNTASSGDMENIAKDLGGMFGK